MLIASKFFQLRISATSAGSPPTPVVPVFREGIEASLSRKWRAVDMRSVQGMEKCCIEVDADECGPAVAAGQPDPIVRFFQKGSQFMCETGGAIPAIVYNALADGWESKLEELVMNHLNYGQDEETSLTKLFDLLCGKKIRIYGNTAHHVHRDAEGNAVWSLESGEFATGKSQPNMDKAVLYIYIRGFEAVCVSFESVALAPFSVGRIRTLIHELVHGMRIMKRLIDFFASLNWSQNPYGDWCIDKNQFLSKIVTPPKLGPNPTFSKQNSDYPADAGRTWEHSITGGKAFFQENFKVVASVGGKFFLTNLSSSEASEVLARPSELIRISRKLADEVQQSEPGDFDMHASNSGLVCNFEYQCQSSGGWVSDHHEQLNTIAGPASVGPKKGMPAE